MTSWREQLAARARAEEIGIYDPRDEHDACGVGLIVALDGASRRDIVDRAIRSLKAVWHRGAVDADGKTGDGAGVRLDVPQNLFKRFVRRTGHLAEDRDVCVGQVFLPRTDYAAQDVARAIVETEILKVGFLLYGWRQTPVDAVVLGAKADATRPNVEQVLFYDPTDRDQDSLERALYLVRRRIEKRIAEKGVPDFYVCSLSSADIIYKGLFLAEDIDAFYPDLRHPEFVSRWAIFHQRYSTNTFPEWRLAQPFRLLAHNGEINTIRGNTNWMRAHQIRMASELFGDAQDDVKPVIQPGASDSAALDQAFEVLVRAGRSAPMAKSLLIPEAWSKRDGLISETRRALYEYCNAVMEPWDGPAAIAAFDGRWAIAGLDRNGLRPMRYAVTEDAVLCVGSETGMCPVGDARVVERGALEAGDMLAFDMQTLTLYGTEEIVEELSAKHPYTTWLANVVDLEAAIGPGAEESGLTGDALRRRQIAAGYSSEDLELILRPMATTGKEPIGSMGDDTPLAVLSDRYRPLPHFLRQKFSQVTNPPIDPLREAGVMSLKTRFKNLGNILISDPAQTDVFVLESPILTNGMMRRLRDRVGDGVAVVDCTYAPQPGGAPGAALRACLDRIRSEANAAVAAGAEHIVLSDEGQGPGRIAAPMLLAAGGVHERMLQDDLRAYCSIIVQSAECLDAHYVACLVSVGATAVNPYLAFDSVADMQARGLLGECSREKAAGLYKEALQAGLLKILSKAGISVVSSYRGGCNFEALGLSRALVAEFFPGATSRISGMGLPGLEARTAALHANAFDAPTPVTPIGGFYRHRRNGERHILEADLIADLQTAVRDRDYDAYKRYVTALERQDPAQLRDLLLTNPAGPARPIDEVESVNTIRQRFVTPGMSLGALSPEAHGALNIAMNRIGAKSVSGEGGEDPTRYRPHVNGDNENSAVKQIASGRFGVTAEYLNQCREIEIKVAQGAKPGEGGQLPGFKVTDFIARMRHSTPGVTLISPPPHHDIYSIEDLAQLIYDLKNINPDARVCVKLVSTAGVGTIAAGVAKANADVILISGNVGGTGASPMTSIKFAGAPWELGLAEAHKILTVNNLRKQVTLRTDGGIRTGRDVVIAAMLGAEEFGIGTISLVALGCLMVRQCHSNTCPVGVCTQDDDLRARFKGLPDHVVNLMSFIAEETREILADLGAKSLEDVIGRSDLLDQVYRGAPELDDLDLNAILARVVAGDRPHRSTRQGRVEPSPTLDEQILRDAGRVFEHGEKMQVDYAVRNTDRSIGARTSSAIVRAFGAQGLPEAHLTVRLTGSAGQSLGVFGATGLRIELTGDANDYVGKGLSGASIVIRPPTDAASRTASDAIVGNTCLFGATDGALFAAGRAGGRFAVRNSGAEAVVEGCAANGCEYMTGGRVVVLGRTGDNFAAGMTGGRAFVLDEDDRFMLCVNPESVAVRRFDVAGPDAEASCRRLIERHAAETGSPRAVEILAAWDRYRGLFYEIAPLEILAREAEGADGVAAA
ncbi:MAG: glutamate synthase large subunit [Pseudomonadota bacterium]